MSSSAVPEMNNEMLQQLLAKLTLRHLILRVVSFLLIAAAIILGWITTSKIVEYDMIPIDKTSFQQYSHNLRTTEYAQAKLARVEEVFSITTSTSTMPRWDSMYSFDDDNLSDSAREIYLKLRESYRSQVSSSSYSYTYVVGRTDENLPIILRISGSEDERITELLPEIQALVLSSIMDQNSENPLAIYGRAVKLTPFNDLDNQEMLLDKDSDIFNFQPTDMDSKQYYTLLSSYPVMDIEDTAAFEKKIRQEDIEQKQIFFTLTIVLGVLALFALVGKQAVSHRIENISAAVKTRLFNQLIGKMQTKNDA
ncbi:MAG: hypothetical protein ACOX7B_00270 [Christensenellales bacterium]